MAFGEVVPPSRETPGVSALARTILPLVSAFVLFSFIAVTPADADLWGHLTFGRDIVQARALPAADAYSFTSDQPWVNHEWLAEVTMWAAYAAGGAAGLVALKLLLAILIVLALLVAWRPCSFPSIWRDALLFATAMSAWPQLQFVRPQMFSLVLFAWLLVALERVRAGRLWWLAAIPPMFAAWVNLHGGWIVGAGALGVFTACTLAGRAVSRGAKLAVLATGGAAVLATVCNPYGTGMLAFLADTVRPNRGDIAEWRPLFEMSAFVIALWIVPALLAALAWWRGRPAVPWSSLLITLMFAAGGFRVVRLVGFFAVAVAVLLVPYLRRTDAAGSSAEGDSEIRLKPDPTGSAFTRTTAPAFARTHQVGSDTQRVGSDTQPVGSDTQHVGSGTQYVGSGFSRILPTVAVCLIVSACALALFGRRVWLDAPWLPEPEAATFIQARGLRGNMLTWFDYGEYAIWHLSPAIRVSMDGRRETIYSERMRALHSRIYFNEAGAMDDVARLNPDLAWLPRVAPIVRTLEAHGWQPVFEGPRSVVLTRSASVPFTRSTAPVLVRSFPGP